MPGRFLKETLRLAVCVSALMAAAFADTGYEWPLELAPNLSSSFGEDRGSRFHMGIDLRTGGVTGKTVLAAADGHVSRVRCSAWGYGKAIYVQFDTGYSAVYGHLDDYYDELRDYVRRNQHARQSYNVDLTPKPGEFRVRRGQAIAKSGDSGSGPPHLHFEPRDPQGRPVNPRLLGMSWSDSTPPAPTKVLVCPDGPDSAVNGLAAPAVLALKTEGPGRFSCPPVRARGKIGFGVEYVDHEPDGLKLGAHRLRLLAGEATVFEVSHDRLSYDNHHNNAVAHHPFLGDLGRFKLLWRWPGNVCESYAAVPETGWWTVPEEGGELVLELVDFMGNRSVIVCPVLRDEDVPQDAPAGAANAARGDLEWRCMGDWLSFTARFPAAEAEPPLVEVTAGGAAARSVAFVRAGGVVFSGAVKFDGAGLRTVRVSHPRLAAWERSFDVAAREKPFTMSLDGGARLEIPERGVYGLLPVSATLDEGGKKGGNLGPVWRLWPENAPLDRPGRITLPLPDTIKHPEKAAVGRQTGSGWAWMQGSVKDGWIQAEISSFGAFSVVEDLSPPRLKEMLPEDGYAAESRRPRIRATVSDPESGVASWSLECGGQWLLAGYDADDGRIVWERDVDLPAGSQELVLRVTDGAGNTAEFRRKLAVPGL